MGESPESSVDVASCGRVEGGRPKRLTARALHYVGQAALYFAADRTPHSA